MKRCVHKNLYDDYYVGLSCPTPYCSGYEVHCRDCDRFISQCGCGFLNGENGWSCARRRA